MPGSKSIPTVHPRVCGERQGERDTERRFIPACAGNAVASTLGTCNGSSPRVRGTRRDCASAHLIDGSSPRVRGTPNAGCETRVLRFIPRVRGTPDGQDAAAVRGSSPRVRGTHRRARIRSRMRFIPACAGNAHADAGRLPVRTVHPRVCGERVAQVTGNSNHAGSSPRVRGTRAAVSYSATAGRFIPACAGNASVAQGLRQAHGSSPRVRGTPPLFIDSTDAGSSPRVRGTREAADRLCLATRFIPACAGNAAAIV